MAADRYIDGVRYVWDQATNTYRPASEYEGTPDHASGGDAQLTRPEVHRMTPKNPDAVGILAPKSAKHVCSDFTEYGYCRECGKHFLDDAVEQPSGGSSPFLDRVPVVDDLKRDDSFPSMSYASAGITVDERRTVNKHSALPLAGLIPAALGVGKAALGMGGAGAAGAAGAGGVAAGLAGRFGPAITRALAANQVVDMAQGEPSVAPAGAATMHPESAIPEVIPPITAATSDDSVVIHGEDSHDLFGPTDGFLDEHTDFGLNFDDMGPVGSDGATEADELAGDLIEIIPVEVSEMGDDDVRMLAELEPAQIEALGMLGMNWALIEEYANDDTLDGSDNPVIVAIDKMLAKAFPGYRDEVIEATDEGDSDSDDDEVEDFTDGEVDDSDDDEDSVDEDEGDEEDENPFKEANWYPSDDGEDAKKADELLDQVDGKDRDKKCSVCGRRRSFGCGCDEDTKEGSVKEARRLPRMCPHHKSLVQTALALGDPAAAISSMAQHEYGPKSCNGDWEGEDGGCKYKPQMVTQSYWDERAEKAEQKRIEKQIAQEEAEQYAEEAETDLLDYDFGTEVDEGYEDPTAEWEADDDLGGEEHVEVNARDFGMEIAASRMAEDYDFGFKVAADREGTIECPNCEGSGGFEDGECAQCTGEGRVDEDDPDRKPRENGLVRDASTRTAEKSDYEPANEGDLGDTATSRPSIDGDEMESAITGGDENADLRDSRGRTLQKGESYLLKTPDFVTPDKVVIDHIKGDTVTFTIKTEATDYQTDISLDEIRAGKYEFEPVKGEDFDPLPSEEEVAEIEPDVEIDAEAEIHRASVDDSIAARANDLFWGVISREASVAKTAGTVTPSALKEILAEGEDGVVARNLSRMDISGTHYERLSSDDIADIFS